MTTVAAAINTVLCLGIAWACLCRSARTSASTTRAAYRYLYPAQGTAALLCALGGWWSELGDWPLLALLSTVLATLYLHSRAWRVGPPAVARKPWK